MNPLLDQAIRALNPMRLRFWTVVAIAAFFADLAMVLAIEGGLWR